MSRQEQDIVDAAAAWHAASAGDDMDWDGFTVWLEADPRHASVYDEVALADAMIDEHRESLNAPILDSDSDDVLERLAAGPGARSTVSHSQRRWLRWGGAGGFALAAARAAVLAIPQLSEPAPQIHTTGDSSETVALADGSTVLVAPHSKLTIAGRHQDRLALEGGGWFDITHQPDRTMTISAGGIRISDIGTRFDVQTGGGEVRVEVGQGQLSIGGDALAKPVSLAQGEALTYNPRAVTAVITPVRGEAIGEWRKGRLTFEAAPLTLVADDIARYAGTKVTMADDLRTRQFSGTLVIGNGDAALRDLGQLMGLGVERTADGYRLTGHR